MMRRPLDHLAGMLRIAGAPPAKLTPQTLRVLAGVQRAQGQLAYGWPSPDGYPTVGAAWSNAGGLISRWNVTFALWQRGLAAIGVSPTDTKAAAGIDVDAFASDLVSTYLADTASTALVSTIADVLNTAADPLNPDAETFAAAMTVITASPQFSLR